MKISNKVKLLIIIVISIIASINAAYLTNLAYSIAMPSYFWAATLDTAKGLGWYVCDINSTFSCSSVFSHSFAWIYWIPFSLIALVVYPIIVIVALLGLFKKIKNHFKIILYMAFWWIIFNWYIIVNEYLIWAYCLLCLICTWIIVVNWILACMWINEKKKQNI